MLKALSAALVLALMSGCSTMKPAWVAGPYPQCAPAEIKWVQKNNIDAECGAAGDYTHPEGCAHQPVCTIFSLYTEQQAKDVPTGEFGVSLRDHERRHLLTAEIHPLNTVR